MQLYLYNGQETNYSINEIGELYNNKTKKWLKGTVNKNGYRVYRVSLGGESKDLYAHRMVAETFIPRSDETKDCVNHKDGNKLNNSKDNLEWVTKGENNYHALKTGLNPLYKKIYCFDKNKVLVCTYSSLQSAALLTGFAINSIADNAAAVAKPLCHGFYWSFFEDNTFETLAPSHERIKPVARYSLDNVLIEKYNSIAEASALTHFPRNRISDCARGKIKTYGGFKWKFL